MQFGNTNCMVTEFMTRKEDLHVLKPSTPVDEGTPVFDMMYCPTEFM